MIRNHSVPWFRIFAESGAINVSILLAFAIDAWWAARADKAKALDFWAYENEVTLDFSRPGKPTDNPFIESFNGSFRDECPNLNWFLSLDDARERIETWCVNYNECRPHKRDSLALGSGNPACDLCQPGGRQSWV